MEQEKNQIIIDKQVVSQKELTCYYHVEGPFEKIFPEKKSLKLQYPFLIGALPKEILVTPFLGCFVPMAMLWDAEIHVESCEKKFYEFLLERMEQIRAEFPERKLGGKIQVETLEELPREQPEGHAVLVVEELAALRTLIVHRKEFPRLLYVKGTGEPETEALPQNHLEQRIYDTAEKFSVSADVIQLYFRGWLREQLEDAPELMDISCELFANACAIPYLWKFQLGLYYMEETVSSPEDTIELIENYEKRTGISVLPKNPLEEISEKTASEREEHNPPYVWLMGVPGHGNLGDHQIAESICEVLHDLAPDVRIQEIGLNEYEGRKEELKSVIRSEDLLIFLGGGFFGNLWPNGDQFRSDVFLNWPDNPKVVFPQSLFYTEDEEGKQALQRAREIYRGENILLAFRDPVSYEFAKKEFQCPVFLTPDIVMYSDKRSYSSPDRKGLLALLRADRERILPEGMEEWIQENFAEKFEKMTFSDMQGSKVSPKARRVVLDQMLERIGQSEIVVTDRLHGLLFSVITETPCVVFGNVYHKIKAYRSWLETLPYVAYAENKEQLQSCIEQVQNAEHPYYPLEEVRKHYREFLGHLKEFLQRSGEQLARRQEKEPLVSVIVPVYNVESYLAQCLDSIQGQSYPHFEVLCINDGSTDHSGEILEKYAAVDSRIQILTQKNEGLSSARNHGMQAARGKYTIFIDSDDWWLPDTLWELVSRAEREELDLLLFDMKAFVMGDGIQEEFLHFQRHYQRQFDYPEVYKGSRMASLMKEKGEYRTGACQYLIRSSILKDHKLSFVRGILHEDNPFTLEVFLLSNRVGYVKKAFYQRRVAPGSIMTSGSNFKQVYGYFRSYLEVHRFIEQLELMPWEESFACREADRILRMAVSEYRKLEDPEIWHSMKPQEQSMFYRLLLAGPEIKGKENKEEKELLEEKLQTTYREKAERGIQIQELQKGSAKIQKDYAKLKRDLEKTEKQVQKLETDKEKLIVQRDDWKTTAGNLKVKLKSIQSSFFYRVFHKLKLIP